MLVKRGNLNLLNIVEWWEEGAAYDGMDILLCVNVLQYLINDKFISPQNMGL